MAVDGSGLSKARSSFVSEWPWHSLWGICGGLRCRLHGGCRVMQVGEEDVSTGRWRWSVKLRLSVCSASVLERTRGARSILILIVIKTHG